MKAGQITAGKWEPAAPILVSGIEHIGVGIMGTKKVIALIGVCRADDEPESIANAYLISAAPELLETLQVAYAESKKGIELLGMPLISQAWHDTTGAAIAKAIGETPC